MKCVAVSDIHLRDVITPPADLLIVGGDVAMRGTPVELNWFANWLVKQPQKHKVWIAGNHELGIEKDSALAQKVAFDTKSIYLDDSFVEIDGVKIWGSPITPWFMDWAFNRARGAEIRAHWDLIPEHLDILITHGPPYGHFDAVGQRHVGCEELLETIECRLKYPPRFHVFGHIHEGYGRSELKRADGAVVELINASICNEYYEAVNSPWEFEV